MNDYIPEISKKRCTKCGGEFPATKENFKTDNRIKGGLASLCKTCHHQYNHKRWQEPEVREHHRNYQNAQRQVPEKHAYLLAREKLQREGAVYQEYRHSPEFRVIRTANEARRRALKSQSGGNVTTAEYTEVLKAHTDPKTGQIICAWCGKPIEKDWHFDHWIPLDKGGKHEAGNLRVMHGKDGDKCNLKKHAKHPFEFGRLI